MLANFSLLHQLFCFPSGQQLYKLLKKPISCSDETINTGISAYQEGKGDRGTNNEGTQDRHYKRFYRRRQKIFLWITAMQGILHI